MWKYFLPFLSQEPPFGPDDTVILAESGGCDTVFHMTAACRGQQSSLQSMMLTSLLQGPNLHFPSVSSKSASLQQAAGQTRQIFPLPHFTSGRPRLERQYVPRGHQSERATLTVTMEYQRGGRNLSNEHVWRQNLQKSKHPNNSFHWLVPLQDATGTQFILCCQSDVPDTQRKDDLSGRTDVPASDLELICYWQTLETHNCSDVIVKFCSIILQTSPLMDKHLFTSGYLA